MTFTTDPHAGQPVVSSGPPLTESQRAIIMIHGRNAGPRNILDLVPRLDRQRFTYLAPAASDNTWYPFSFLAEIERNEPYLTSALRRLERVLSETAAAGVPTEHLVLLGFSQGACLAAEFAWRNATRYGGIVLFSGGLIGPPGTTWERGGSLAGTPVFLGCSDVDAHVPKTRVDESAQVFERIGGDVIKRIYPGMGHMVNDDEIACAQRLLDSVPNL